MSKRVLLLIKGLGRGGAEQILASAAPHLDHARFEYHVAYLLPRKDALVKELEDAGVSTHCLHGQRGVRWVGGLRTLVGDLRVDLVHAHSPVAASAARVVLRGDRPRMVYTEHNVWERYHPLTSWANAVTFARQRSRLRCLGSRPRVDRVPARPRVAAHAAHGDAVPRDRSGLDPRVGVAQRDP